MRRSPAVLPALTAACADGTAYGDGHLSMLEASDLETIYVSGDNASLDVVRSIAQRVGPIDIAVLHAGPVQRPQELDCNYLTLSSDHAAEAAKILGVRVVVPVHFEGWTHFTQGAPQLRARLYERCLVRRRALSLGEDTCG
jgi:L-ascorbate metabolism protein UlaG (beta-lactamase superfamily)